MRSMAVFRTGTNGAGFSVPKPLQSSLRLNKAVCLLMACSSSSSFLLHLTMAMSSGTSSKSCRIWGDRRTPTSDIQFETQDLQGSCGQVAFVSLLKSPCQAWHWYLTALHRAKHLHINLSPGFFAKGAWFSPFVSPGSSATWCAAAPCCSGGPWPCVSPRAAGSSSAPQLQGWRFLLAVRHWPRRKQTKQYHECFRMHCDMEASW